MQGFNRYFPPDFDPKTHDTLNNYHGKHALGDRARKIDKGILITRFELPFNIWCGSCEAHIGMGVRYNAEKKKIGMYYTTPIYSFRCKCHLCGNWFEIRTDPKNTCYVVESGARQKHEEWDQEENGGIVLTHKEDGEPLDPFAQVDKKNSDKITALQSKDRLEELQEFSESRNSDPFALSQRLRKTFRKEKAELISKSNGDDQLRTKYSLPTGLKFIEPSDSKDSITEQEQVKEARRMIDNHRAEVEAKRTRLSAEMGLQPIRTHRGVPPKAAQLATLKQKLTTTNRNKKIGSSIPASSLVSRRPMSRAKPISTTSSDLQIGSSKLPSSALPSIVNSAKPLATLACYLSD
ncbi:hypothetical protein Pst134EA_011957 [Puccinia striiformis f. sp. tritici]|uniref:Coiled-coil domain-containing protein 130 n=1 Tax=Puccinia striiformis f. sp. tritici PST-78 TaxID=1165861 RepID=A0A0L0VLC8_9BASI|nr:hypothetical protein Pst134EA_011957 [Puccinia striiformis f. sp. tritici]KAH9456706.1 hypothetical protein Pst134EB_012912 [Puccinia striiformis f. sp. tritici]KAH9468332.1 hypothetical protein Pst134EA_011957 [Puccinia striiformis f. sp. tritici]KAI9619478.1 hypothetical protein H4Q26_014240 [Puccinia striiformis f. sp. tritici PST-130]KNF00088.1 hypothetical protein PSTG_06710 [Puccinia striiformis f. sp. tritici PST-78]